MSTDKPALTPNIDVCNEASRLIQTDISPNGKDHHGCRQISSYQSQNSKSETTSSETHHHLSSSCSLSSNLFTWVMTCFAAIGGFLFGYDQGVTSGAMLLLKDKFELSSVWQELIISAAVGTAFLAALIGGKLNDQFGRRPIILLASVVFTAGAVILGVAMNVQMLIGGRVLIGVSVGLTSMTVPVYIAEGAPSHLRGRLVTVYSLFVNAGQFVSCFVDAGFSYVETDGWRYMLGVGGLPSMLQFMGFLFLPESPRWLMSKGRERHARIVLERVRGHAEVGQELEDIKNSLEMERSMDDGGPTLLRMFRTPAVRRALVVGCSTQLFQQLIGINTVMYYSASIMRMSGIGDPHQAILLTAALASTNFLFTFVGVWLVDRVGRKKLTIGSLLGVGLSLGLSATAFQFSFNQSSSMVIQGSDAGYKYSPCSTYRWCDQCIEDLECGFCFTHMNGSVLGSCLPTDPDHPDHSTTGQCGNSTSPMGYTWAYNSCPNPYWWMAILGLILYLVFFAPGMGPVPWIINAEIYPLWARSTGNSLSAATNWFASIVISMTFLTFTETLTIYGTFWLYSGFAFLGVLLFGFFLPETKGQKLENVEELFKDPLHSGCCRTKPSSLSSDTETTKNIEDGYSTLCND